MPGAGSVELLGAGDELWWLLRQPRAMDSGAVRAVWSWGGWPAKELHLLFVRVTLGCL